MDPACESPNIAARVHGSPVRREILTNGQNLVRNPGTPIIQVVVIKEIR
jgi:hypothetical protein